MQKLKQIPKRVHHFLIGLVLTAVLGVLAFAVVNTYTAYTDMVVQQQQQYLLVTARAVSKTLSLYISGQLRDIEILTRSPGFLTEFENYYETGGDTALREHIVSYMLSQKRGVKRIYLLDKNGDVMYQYNDYPFLEVFDESLLHLKEYAAAHTSGIGSVFRISPQHYGLTLVNDVIHGSESLGTVVIVIDLEQVYEEYLAPLNIENTGDIIVKNEKGTIIMHPNAKLLTFNPFRQIQGLDTLPQYKGLNELLTRQYSQEEGTAIYRDYSNGIAPPEDEIAAFSRMNVNNTAWYVSAVLPHSTVKNLIDRNVGQFGMLVAAILFVLGVCVISFYAMRKNQQNLKLEAAYLKDINHTLKELHQSREQVYHYQKLQTIGALAGGIVHEFNNLLTPILGYSEFIRERMGPESEYYDDMSEIYEAGTRAKEIVEQLLPFSRRETDSTAYGPVNLEAVLQDDTKMVSMILPSNIRLEKGYKDIHATVYGSATQLHQVLLNLCSNAVQAMEGKGGTLTVQAEKISADALPANYHPAVASGFVRVRVADTGCGMTSETLAHIFDAFFTTKAAGEGTGLGLSVVQNILISHGGFIEAHSTVGEGSEFLVYLPVTAQAVAPERPAAPGAPVRLNSGKQPILLVDDEERVARYLKRRLTRSGYTVDVFTDAEEALDAFLASPTRWQLALVDGTMPKYKGTALIQRMRSENPNLAAILMTGFVEQDAVQMQQEGLIDEIFLKPLDYRKLTEKIGKLLAGEPDLTTV